MLPPLPCLLMPLCVLCALLPRADKGPPAPPEHVPATRTRGRGKSQVEVVKEQVAFDESLK